MLVASVPLEDVYSVLMLDKGQWRAREYKDVEGKE